MQRKNGKIRAFMAGIAFIALSPLMLAAIISKTPPVKTAIIYAADASARLAAGDIFLLSREDFIAQTGDLPETEYFYETENEDTRVIRAYLSFDDSAMLSYGALDIPSSANEEVYVPDETPDSGPRPYPESIESRDGTIISYNYGTGKGDEYLFLAPAGQARNVTGVPNARLLTESGKKPEFIIEKNGEPQVLIMHTHTTESFEPYERDFFDKSFSNRTTDSRMNVAAVGNTIKEELEKAGIAVIHDTTMHDYPSYNGSYDRSRETVKAILEEYPSIKIVLDIHRDAIERADGSRVAPVASIGGRNAAQVMIISGCDDGSMGMPDYMQNFRFASLLQSRMESDYPTLTRPLLFDYRKYNQDLTTGSILIEVGAHANSIEQALYSAELIGKSLVSVLEELM